MGFRLTPGYVMAATLAAAVVWTLSRAALDTDMLGAALLTLFAVMLIVLSWRGSTLVEWVIRRRRVSVPTPGVLVSTRDKAAVLRDPVRGTATAWLEVAPKDAFALTTVDGNDHMSHPPLDVDLLAEMMTQDDIVVSTIEIVTLGHASVVPTPTAQEISRVAGTVPTHHGGRVLLKVTVDMAQAHAAITARASRGDYAAGLSKTLLAAAARIRIRLDASGIRANLLTPAQIDELTAEVAPFLAGTPKWGSLQGDKVTTSFFTPTATPPAGAQDEWLRVGSRRTFENIILSRERGEVMAGYVVGYTATGTSSVADQVKGLPLRLLGGQQLQAASRFVPLVADADVVVPTLPRRSVRAWPGTLGTYIGRDAAGTRTFMNIEGGAGTTLHVSGSLDLGKQMLVRMSKQHLAIDVRMASTPEMAEEWRGLVNSLRSPLVTFNQRRNPDVVVVPAGVEIDYATSQVTVVAVGVRRPSIPPAASITSTGSALVVTSGAEQREVRWEQTTAEASLVGFSS